MAPTARSKIDWAVVAAFPRELGDLRRRTGARRIQSDRFAWIVPREPSDCLLITTGIGAERAEERTRAIIRQHRPRRAIVCGFGGALDPALRSGDVVLASEVIDVATHEVFHPSRELVAIALEALRSSETRRGTLAVAPTIAPDSESKRTIAQETSAACVDLESAGCARALEDEGCPALFARVIVDELDTRFPKGALELLDANGRARPGALARLIAREPRSIASLVDLGKRSRRAAHALATFVQTIIEGASSPPAMPDTESPITPRPCDDER